MIDQKSKHRFSTYCLIGLLVVGVLVGIVSAINSEELDEICNESDKILYRNGEWACKDPNSFNGNLTVSGLINNVPPHMFGIATDEQTAVSVDNWYNITFNASIGDIENMTFNGGNNDNLTILYDGHYVIDFEVSLIDSSPSPNANVAIRVIKNGVEVAGSYREVTTAKQNAVVSLGREFEVIANAGDTLNMQWITSDTDVSVNTLNTYSDEVSVVATGIINRVGGI